MSLEIIYKRNGVTAPYNKRKIKTAIRAACHAQSFFDEDVINALADDVDLELQENFSPDTPPRVEDVQDTVESILIRYNYHEIASAYIRYREQRRQHREGASISVDVQSTIQEYLDKLDWRVNANSNQGYSLGGLILNTSGKVIANYWLSSVYPYAISEIHRNADLHIHDLDMLSGYCAGWSLRALLEEGFNGVANKIESGPPKHLSSAIAQMVNFLGTLQNEWAGAQAFSSFDTYLAPYVKKYAIELEEKIDASGAAFSSEAEKQAYLDGELYDYVYQQIQSFVFNLNIPSRWGTQTPFTNITLDLTCPEDLRDRQLLLGGELFPHTFGELQHEMDLINQAFVEVMTKGDAMGRNFTFPIPTYNITKDFDWENPKYDTLFEMTAKYGTPYFQNFINSDMNPGDVRSMCCRLQLDMKELRKRGGGLFGSAEMTGSIGVVTLNMARIGYTHRASKEVFLQRMDQLMELAKSSLEIKRKEIQKWMDGGLFPYTRRYLGTLRNHFSTIGANGLNEAILNFTEGEEDITSEWGQQFAQEVLDYMRERMSMFQEETGNMYNLEATPAEGTTYRFAKEDQKRFPDIIQAGTVEAPYYTNSSQIPVGHTDDVFEALDLQDALQTKYTGGTVFHAYLSERVESSVLCRKLVRRILERYHLPYLTITPTFSICPIHGYLTGEYDFCPRCDEENNVKDAPLFDSEYRKTYTATVSK